jgi:hypothetical protein
LLADPIHEETGGPPPNNEPSPGILEAGGKPFILARFLALLVRFILAEGDCPFGDDEPLPVPPALPSETSSASSKLLLFVRLFLLPCPLNARVGLITVSAPVSLTMSASCSFSSLIDGLRSSSPKDDTLDCDSLQLDFVVAYVDAEDVDCCAE